MNDEKRELKAGGRLVMTLTNNDTGDVVLREEHEIIEAPGASGAKRGAPGTEDQPQLDTRMVSQQWSDPELEQLNKDEEHKRTVPLRGAKEAIDAGKLGLDIAKFAWDVVKANKAVTDAKATTTSVLYKGTSGMDYQIWLDRTAQAHCAEVHCAWQPGIAPALTRLLVRRTHPFPGRFCGGALPTDANPPQHHARWRLIIRQKQQRGGHAI